MVADLAPDVSLPTLVTAVRDGDHAAFAAWTERTQATVYRVCLRYLHDPDDAADVTATVYLHAWRARATLKPDGACIGWLCRVARNASISELRRRRRRTAEPLTEAHVVLQIQPDEAPAWAEASERALAVRAVLASLPPHQATILRMRDQEDRSIADIAAVIGLSQGATKSALFRARDAFRWAWRARYPEPE